MAYVNLSSVPVTSGQAGIISPMRIRMISDRSGLAPPGSSTMRGLEAPEPAQPPVSMRASEGSDDTFSESDSSSVNFSQEHDMSRITGIVDAFEEKVTQFTQKVTQYCGKLENLENELRINRDLVSLQYRSLLSVQSYDQIRGMCEYVNKVQSGIDNNSTIYETVLSPIMFWGSQREDEKEENESLVISDSINAGANRAANAISINSAANMAIIEDGNEILAENNANNSNQQRSVANNSADMGATARNSQRNEQTSNAWIAPGVMNGNGVQANQAPTLQGVQTYQEPRPQSSSTPVRQPRQREVPNIIEVSETDNQIRKRNLVIANIPENLVQGDRYWIEHIFELIECGSRRREIKKIIRLGEPRENRARLIKVEMSDANVVDSVLEKKNLLNESSKPNVYIDADLSKAERARAYQERLNRRSRAAESLSYEGRGSGRSNTLGDFLPVNFQVESNNRGMVNRRWEDNQPRNFQLDPNPRNMENRRESNQPRDSELPTGWATRRSRSNGLVYYLNTLNGYTTYDFPTEPARCENRGQRNVNQRQAGNEQRQQNEGNRTRYPNSNENPGTSSGNRGDWGEGSSW